MIAENPSNFSTKSLNGIGEFPTTKTPKCLFFCFSHFHRIKISSTQTVSTAASVTSKLIEPTIWENCKIYRFSISAPCTCLHAKTFRLRTSFQLEMKNWTRRKTTTVRKDENNFPELGNLQVLCMEIGLKIVFAVLLVS